MSEDIKFDMAAFDPEKDRDILAVPLKGKYLDAFMFMADRAKESIERDIAFRQEYQALVEDKPVTISPANSRIYAFVNRTISSVTDATKAFCGEVSDEGVSWPTLSGVLTSFAGLSKDAGYIKLERALERLYNQPALKGRTSEDTGWVTTVDPNKPINRIENVEEAYLSIEKIRLMILLQEAFSKCLLTQLEEAKHPLAEAARESFMKHFNWHLQLQVASDRLFINQEMPGLLKMLKLKKIEQGYAEENGELEELLVEAKKKMAIGLALPFYEQYLLTDELGNTEYEKIYALQHALLRGQEPETALNGNTFHNYTQQLHSAFGLLNKMKLKGGDTPAESTLINLVEEGINAMNEWRNRHDADKTHIGPYSENIIDPDSDSSPRFSKN